jgi:hypothetical protein
MLLASDHQGSSASETGAVERDHRCRSFAELRSIMVNARALALRDTEKERAGAAVERWLLAELEMDRAVSAAAGDNSVMLSYVRVLPERIAA